MGMKKLIKGLHKFQTEVFPIHKDFFEDLTKGQNPEILFITCSDSRINPHLVTSAEPGDLFILRNAGNIIPVYGSSGSEAATIEFALCELQVKHIIVCGHSHCGTVEGALDLAKFKNQPNLHTWISNHLTPTLHLVQKNYPNLDHNSLLNVLLQEHVLQQIENLKTHPVVAHAMNTHKVVLHAWVYKFEQGNIFSFNKQEEQFELIKNL